MTFLSALGGFPEMLLGLAFSLGCALLLAFVCLRSLLGFMTRQQHRAPQVHNEVNDPSHVQSILWLGAAVASPSNAPAAIPDSSRANNDGRGVPIGGPYILPVAEASAHFARSAEPDAAFAGRVVELPQVVAGRAAQIGYLDGGDAA